MFRWISAFSLILYLTLSAQAKDDTITVPANKTTGVLGFFVYGGSSCYHAGKLRSSVVRKPAHGKISILYQQRIMPAPLSKLCGGKKMGAMVVTYTPDRGYRGSDTARVTFYYPKYEDDEGSAVPKTFTISVSVK